MKQVSISIAAAVWCAAITAGGCETATNNVGPQGPAGADGAAGANGANGTDGADGQLRVYGDGSAGELKITNNASFILFEDIGTNGNLQFTNVTIDAGCEFFVPSGVVIHCTGTFSNNGTIGVSGPSPGTASGYILGTNTVYVPPAIGITGSQASAGALGDATLTRGGGQGAKGFILDEIQNIYMPGMFGGGSGAGGLGGNGGPGGGTFVVLAQTSITNGTTGTIDASGGFAVGGGGGGAGGVIVLASPGSITNGGTIRARGGLGGPSNTSNGAGGGGSGGIVRMISPSITPGSVNVVGGLAGTPGAAMTVTNNPHAGGGGGGACGGDGGGGGSVTTAGTPTAGTAGQDGVLLQTKVNPTALFF